MLRFFRTSIAFGLGLAAVLFVFERTATKRIEATDGQSLIIRDVYGLPKWASTSGPEVERVYLGDSVTRQFYPVGAEPHPRVRFLPSNGGLTIAGNYYLLEAAFRASPRARDAILIVRPETLQTNLDPPYAGDFFCGLFHTGRQVWEVFLAKRDLQLTMVHIGRWWLSSTIAINAAWRQEPEALLRPLMDRARDGFKNVSVAPVQSERLLKALSYLWGGARDVVVDLPAPDKVTDVFLSPVAAVYLEKMRALTASRGGTLRVLSTPYPDTLRWRDPDGVFDAPMFYLPIADFGDFVHVGPPRVWMPSQVGSPVARRFAESYGLLEDLPVRAPNRGQ